MHKPRQHRPGAPFLRSYALDLLAMVRENQEIDKEQLFGDTIQFYRWVFANTQDAQEMRVYTRAFTRFHPELLKNASPYLQEARFITWFIAAGFHKLALVTESQADDWLFLPHGHEAQEGSEENEIEHLLFLPHEQDAQECSEEVEIYTTRESLPGELKGCRRLLPSEDQEDSRDIVLYDVFRPGSEAHEASFLHHWVELRVEKLEDEDHEEWDYLYVNAPRVPGQELLNGLANGLIRALPKPNGFDCDEFRAFGTRFFAWCYMYVDSWDVLFEHMLAFAERRPTPANIDVNLWDAFFINWFIENGLDQRLL